MEDHSLGCSWSTDQICTCHHIATLAEEAEWVQETPMLGLPSYVRFSTLTSAYPLGYPAGTWTMKDPLRSKSWADEEAEALKRHHMAKEEARAEIYAKADAKAEALRKKTGGIY